MILYSKELPKWDDPSQELSNGQLRDPNEQIIIDYLGYSPWDKPSYWQGPVLGESDLFPGHTPTQKRVQIKDIVAPLNSYHDNINNEF